MPPLPAGATSRYGPNDCPALNSIQLASHARLRDVLDDGDLDTRNEERYVEVSDHQPHSPLPLRRVSDLVVETQLVASTVRRRRAYLARQCADDRGSVVAGLVVARVGRGAIGHRQISTEDSRVNPR